MSRKALVIRINGETMTAAEWAERLGITTIAMYKRLGKGLSDERLLAKKGDKSYTKRGEIIKAFGREQTISQWAKEVGINRSTIWERIHRYGYTPEKSLSHHERDKTMKQSQLAKEAGVSLSTIRYREKNGNDVLKRSIYGQRAITIADYLKRSGMATAKEIALAIGANATSVSMALSRNKDLFEILHHEMNGKMKNVKTAIWRLKP